MHDFLIALVFVSLVAAPAVVAALPSEEQEEAEPALASTSPDAPIVTSSDL